MARRNQRAGCRVVWELGDAVRSVSSSSRRTALSSTINRLLQDSSVNWRCYRTASQDVTFVSGRCCVWGACVQTLLPEKGGVPELSSVFRDKEAQQKSMRRTIQR